MLLLFQCNVTSLLSLCLCVSLASLVNHVLKCLLCCNQFAKINNLNRLWAQAARKIAAKYLFFVREYIFVK